MQQLPVVRDLMDKTFVKLRPEMDVYEAIDTMLRSGITGAAVVDENDRVVGLLSEKDCLRTLLVGAYDRQPLGNVADYMTKVVMTISPDIEIFELVEIFLKQVYRRLLVVENGKLVGQVTRRDTLRAIQNIIKDNKFKGMRSSAEPEHTTGLSFSPRQQQNTDPPYKS